MEIFVAIIIIALVAGLVWTVLQLRAQRVPPAEHRGAPPVHRRGSFRHRRSMAAAIDEHARAMEPADALIAEQRLRAEASVVASRHQVNTPGAGPATMGPAVPVATDPSLDESFDPVTGARIDGPVDPADDPRLDDPRYDGRLAVDYPYYAERRRGGQPG